MHTVFPLSRSTMTCCPGRHSSERSVAPCNVSMHSAHQIVQIYSSEIAAFRGSGAPPQVLMFRQPPSTLITVSFIIEFLSKKTMASATSWASDSRRGKSTKDSIS